MVWRGGATLARGGVGPTGVVWEAYWGGGGRAVDRVKCVVFNTCAGLASPSTRVTSGGRRPGKRG